MSLVTGLAEVGGTPTVVACYTAAIPALVLYEVYSVSRTVLGPGLCSRGTGNAIGTEEFTGVLHLVRVVFALFLASEVDTVTAETLVEAEPVQHIAFWLVEVIAV